MNVLKSFRNFAIVNLCAVFPLLWAVLGWMPDQVKVRMHGWKEAPGPIMANGAALAGEEYGEWSGGRIFRFYLRAGMAWKDLVFRFPGASGIEAVEQVQFQKWKLLSLGKRGSGLVKREGGTDEYVFAKYRFDSVGLAGGKVGWVLAVTELFLAFLSWQCVRRHREEAWTTLLPSAIAVALALTFLTQVALPIQSFLANRASYPFTGGELTAALAERFAWTLMLEIAAVTLLARCFGRRAFGVVFALALCIYLESGILSNGLANLNGDIFLLQDRTRAIWDAVVWVTVFVVILVAHPLLRKHYTLASLCLMIMVGASLIDTKHEHLADKTNLIVHDFVSVETAISNVTYSTNRNVMVFILDSLEREQAHAIMEDPEVGPKLREQFQGFTEYANNVGALPQTLVAVPNLLTGRYPDGTDSMMDYAWSCYASNSVLRDFLEMGYDAFITTPALGCGFTTRTNGWSALDANCSALDRPGNGGDAWSVRNFSRWRYMPFAAKAGISALMGFANSSDRLREWGVYPKLAEAGISPNTFGTFLWVHTEGVHVPTDVDRHGRMLAVPDYSERGCIEQGVFALESLGNLMDFYRKAGIYDNSLILVLGDHGEHQERKFLQDCENGRLPGNARPCLWVKPFGNTDEFGGSAEPTSHCRVADLLRTAVCGQLSEEKIKDLLQSDKRVYRRMAMQGDSWTDWVVDRSGVFTTEEHQITLSDEGQQRPLVCGYRYPLHWKQMDKAKATILFHGTGIDSRPFLSRYNRTMSIEFIVPDPNKRYLLKLELFDAKGGHLRFRCDTSASEWVDFEVLPHAIITVQNVVADATGMARVLCERSSGPDVDVAFASLMLQEEK